MKKELLKFTRSENPEKNYETNCHLVVCRGDGIKSQQWEVRHIERHMDEVDIALLSYFSNRDYHGGERFARWKTEWLYKDIFKGPLAFILPYMYDHDEFGVFDSGWDEINSIEVFWCDENGTKFKEELPKITDIFNNVDELIDYIKEQMKIIRHEIVEEEMGGTLLMPWEIDEAREVLKQSGWTEQEIRYLRWVGCDRGFGACIEVEQKFADYMCTKFDENDKKDKFVLKVLLDGLKIANQKCTSLGFNGPKGMCGTYIYRSSEKIIEEYEIPEEDIVRMDNGRVYVLHEGD